jgi:hypothetical protein
MNQSVELQITADLGRLPSQNVQNLNLKNVDITLSEATTYTDD